jgi:hypothetical protein
MSRNTGKSGAEQMAAYSGGATRGRLVDVDETLNRLSCGLELSKKILIGINVFFLIFGAIIIGLGAYTMQGDTSIYFSSALPTGIIVLGVFILFLSFLGCFGAMRENRILLAAYAGILLIIFICQLIIACVILADQAQVAQYLSDAWTGASVATKQKLQSDFGCCGYNTFNDTQAAQPCPTGSTQGCYQLLQSSLTSKLSLLGGFGIFLAFIQLFGVVLALVLRAGILGTYSFGTR